MNHRHGITLSQLPQLPAGPAHHAHHSHTKLLAAFYSTLLLLLCLSAQAEPSTTSDPCSPLGMRPDGQIILLTATAQILRQPHQQLEAKRGTVLCSGDSITVSSHGESVIRYRDDTVINLDGGTTLTLPAASDETSPLLKLVKGIIYLLVRDPHGLKLDTPFYRAGVEGTEFTSEAGHQGYTWVMEGRVRVASASGETLLERGESATVEQSGSAPQALTLSPATAVQWAIYYPALLDKGLRPASNSDTSIAAHSAWQHFLKGEFDPAITAMQQVPRPLQDAAYYSTLAAMHLARHDIQQAEKALAIALKLNPQHPHAIAQKSLILLQENRITEAESMLSRSTASSAAVQLGKSYLLQAQQRIDEARNMAELALRSAANSPLAAARLSETCLMQGDISGAITAADTATRLAQAQPLAAAHANTVRGFAKLASQSIDIAETAFAAAIEQAPLYPQAWLGKGLAAIHQGQLRQGRESLEVAVVLSPLRALYRSYLGKAYLDENRPTLAYTQFELAKQLDPLSPLPWLFESQAKSLDNQPVAASQSLEEAGKRLKNRAVYRAPELLASDQATHLGSQGATYARLGFDQLALQSAQQGIDTAPADPASHAELVHALQRLENRKNALDREQWQHNLRAPLSVVPQQLTILSSPQALDAALSFQNTPTSGYEEYQRLFNHQGQQRLLDAFAGTQGTLAESLRAGSWKGRTALAAQQLHYDSDGYRDNQSLNYDSIALGAQRLIGDRRKALFQLSHQNWNSGDLAARIDNSTDPDFKQSIKDTRLDLALQHQPDARHNWLIAASFLDSQEVFNDGARVFTLETQGDTHAGQAEIQHILSFGRNHWTLGAQVQRQRGKIETAVTTRATGETTRLPAADYRDTDLSQAYAYLTLEARPALTTTLGLNYHDLEVPRGQHTGLLPKLGIRWQTTPQLTLRAAAFKTLQSTLLINQSLEPTTLAGFTQFDDLQSGSVLKQYSLGIDHKTGSKLFTGLEAVSQTVTPLEESGQEGDRNRPEIHQASAYLNWPVNSRISLAASLEHYRFERQTSPLGQPCNLTTRSLPLEIRYFAGPRLTARFKITAVDQDVNSIDSSLFAESCAGADRKNTQSRFSVLDFGLDYRLPGKGGQLSLQVKNLLDEQVEYQDNSFQYRLVAGSSKKVFVATPYAPERSLLLTYSVSF